MDFEITEFASRLIIFLIVLLLSISIHEAGHAWMSYRFGDDTAYLLGRVTLNPIAHTDPIGTLLLPIIGFISVASGGISLIGWGKPCPVNPLKWRNKDAANFWVSIAGVLGNLILVITAFVLIKGFIVFNVIKLDDLFSSNPIGMFLSNLLFMNVSLIVFNLLPFPPLDGSKILENFLPASTRPVFEMLEQFGFLVLFALVATGMTSYIFTPVFKAVVFALVAVN
jgi:Zn-dependent protease